MPNCKFCGQPVTSAPVYHPECLEKQAAGGWISVEERLPGDGAGVLVFLGTGAMSISWQWRGKWAEKGVTYWMPLPEPPKEG